MDKVRMGIIGVGNMGSLHATWLLEGQVPRCELTALCDVDPARMAAFPKVRHHADSAELIRSGEVDAVIVATPHYGHTTIGADALGQGLHVLVEKPISVHKADCQRLIASRKSPAQVFSTMFQCRTDPHFIKLRDLVRGGELGELRRVEWVITAWFRIEAYYRSGTWRATWGGEGGGVLLNQCPHQLDLLCWMCGLPGRVTAVCGLGRRHRIEVEDEASALLEFPGGATGMFVASTGEAPGVNRLEVAGTRGRAVLEGQELTLARNRVPSDRFCRTAREPFSAPPFAVTRRVFKPKTDQHAAVIRNFVDAILDGVAPVAPAAEGMASLELANAMLLSSLRRRAVDLPLDADAYARALRRLVRGVRASP